MVTGRIMVDLNAQNIAKMAWAFVTTSQLSVPLMLSLEKTMTLCMHASNAQDLANIAWSFAAAGRVDMALFALLTSAADRDASDYAVQNLVSVACALAEAS
eukprot:gnl/TRDRNA2_/TRDRNA2_160872_c3_seq2.p1 gnl/TRDRNA2_/TRDRNA2_160872_c3~~gnl/TRDRNA2_/TRDRNA2_160872_c3_seq2.p1  ORF type:complete len:101 (+),score=14.94 gnl/TRDRNA2_/TRDRNA2_160872_c3_seq2:639-941(+)